MLTSWVFYTRRAIDEVYHAMIEVENEKNILTNKSDTSIIAYMNDQIDHGVLLPLASWTLVIHKLQMMTRWKKG